MSSHRNSIYTYLGKVILITLLIVLFVRSFIVSPLTISSTQMEDTLYNGNKILISKTAYGIRLPITLLGIPFTFDNLFGLSSYSSAIQLPYHRLFTREVKRNDIVLFNNPLELEKPLDKRSLILSRCVALPNDTIVMRNGFFLVNGEPYEASPNSIQEYWIERGYEAELNSIANEQNIQIHHIEKRGDTLFAQLSKYDAYLLNENIGDTLRPITFDVDTTKSYTITLPKKGYTITIDENNLIVYKQIILQEQQKKVVKIENGQLLIDGAQQEKYTFCDSYYWMLSDNTTNSIDSRNLGFIPFRSIIGKASYIWYSPAKEKGDGGFCFLPAK